MGAGGGGVLRGPRGPSRWLTGRSDEMARAGWGRGAGCCNAKPQEGCPIGSRGWAESAAGPATRRAWGLPPVLGRGELGRVKSLWENQDSPASFSWPESPQAPKPWWGQGQLRGGGCRGAAGVHTCRVAGRTGLSGPAVLCSGCGSPGAVLAGSLGECQAGPGR